MFSEVEGVYLVEWRGACLMKWRGYIWCGGGVYAECRRVYVQKTYEVEGWGCGSAHMECPFHQLRVSTASSVILSENPQGSKFIV